MQFYSISFLFLFLPVVILGSLLLSRNASPLRDCWLLLSSFAFYAFGNLMGLNYLLCVIAVTYLASLWLFTTRPFQRTVFTLSILFLIAILFYYKWAAPNALPIGISFYTFQAISYLSDIRSSTITKRPGLLSFALYLSFFPQLIAGPIVRYSNVENRLLQKRRDSLALTVSNMTIGAYRFVLGLSKKILLADQFAAGIALWEQQAPSVLLAWMHAIAYTLQIYFDFSGYSDMAIGLGWLFGFQFPENFDTPYRSTCMTEFWRRWHITLGAWFRDYVYLPLGGSRNKTHNPLFTVRNLLLVFLLTGLWHGIGLPFLIWGLSYGILLSVERIYKKPRGLIGHAYVLFLTILLFVLFESPTISHALLRYRQMFFLNHLSLWNSETFFFLNDNLLLFLIGILLSVCCSKQNLDRYWKKLRPVLAPLLVLLSLAALISKTAQPFLYFQF